MISAAFFVTTTCHVAKAPLKSMLTVNFLVLDCNEDPVLCWSIDFVNY